jgi:flagellar biosynthesis protein FlhB
MTFSYSAVWDDTMRLLREHGALLAAVAGVFIFLPALLFARYLPPPHVADPARAWELFLEYYRQVFPWLVLESLFSLVGTAAMLRLVLAPGTSVGAALVYGLMLLPFYFLMYLLISVMVSIGFVLLILPGLYLVGRMVPAAPVMVAEDRRNPIDAIRRTFEITKGRGWAVFGLVFIVAIVGFILLAVITMLIGFVLLLVAGPELGRLLTTVLSSAGNAALATVILMLYVAIYRALAPR